MSSLINIPFPEGVNSDAPVSKLDESESPIIRNVMTRYLPTQVIPRNGIPVVTSWSLALDGTDQWAEADGWFPYFAAPSHDGRTFLIGTTDGTCKWAPYYQPTDLPKPEYKNEFLYKKGYGFIEVDLTVEPDPNDPYDPSYNMSYGTWKSGKDKGIQANFWGQWAHYDGMTFICAAADTLNGTATVKYAAEQALEKGKSQAWTYSDGNENVLPLAFLQAWSGRVTISATAPRNESLTITPVFAENRYSTKMGPIDAKHIGRIAWHGAGTDKPLTHYAYKIKSTTHFERPYLLGLKKDEGPASTNMIGEYAPVVHAPIGSHTLAVFRERVFGARAHISQTWDDTKHQRFPEAIEGVGGYYGNAVVWSQPGAPTKWPTTNYAIVDNDDADPITAMYAMDDALYIFKATRTYRMVGYDEESFSVEKVSNVVGCPYPNGVTAYEGTMYFVSDDAVYAMTGGELENLTMTGSGKGISNLLAERPWALHKSRQAELQQEVQGSPMYEHYWPTVAVTPDGHLLMCCQDIKGGYDPLKLTDNFCYDIATGTWSEWGYYNKALNPMRVLQGPTGRVYGIHHAFMTELTDVWNPTAKQLPVYDEVPNLTPEYLHWYEAPDMYTGDIWIGRQWQMEMLKSALTRTPVPVQMDVYVSSPGSTTRINEMQIDHGIYAEAEYTKPTWQVSFASDPDMREVIDTHTIKPRVKGKADTVGLDEYHFSDRLLNTFQREGQTIRIVFTCLTDITDNPPESYRLYNVFMVAEQVRTLGVDNTPTE